jgi:HSP20 family protein
MTLYITPSGRVLHRNQWDRIYSDEPQTAAEVDVYIPVNVKAEAEKYVITAMVPGVKAEELTVQVHNDILTIEGELKDNGNEKDQFLLYELPKGRFYRTIRFPEKLDPSSAVAELNDGLLTLHLSKAEEVRPKTIKVSVS